MLYHYLSQTMKSIIQRWAYIEGKYLQINNGVSLFYREIHILECIHQRKLMYNIHITYHT